MTQIVEKARNWLAIDRNAQTRAQIEKLLDTGDVESLTPLFASRISFGTAGLRAKMEAGESRMNDVTVIQASQGLAHYVKENVENALDRGVVVAHDHRHNSSRFAQLTLKAFERVGFKLHPVEGYSHTPIVPFTVGHIKAACGIMITASHNPAADNGYKVYWENGVQIVPPHDARIAQKIDQCLHIDPEAWLVTEEPIARDAFSSQMYHEYFKAAVADLSFAKVDALPLLTYTAMHGVGAAAVQQAWDTFNFPKDRILVVDEQNTPDPDFPTVKFPNPEEKGALDLAMSTADKNGSRLVLANDPDADRFEAAEKVGDSWTVFSGDQLGILLGHYVLRHFAARHSKLGTCASTVSSKMLAALAAKEGYTFAETLTGFKYLGNEAITLEAKGISVPFAYEEAIGFMCGTAIRDKDGITALAVFVQLISAVYSQGMTLKDRLEHLYDTYGYFKTWNSYYVSQDPKVFAHIFNALRFNEAGDVAWPSHLGPFKLKSIRDLTVGYDSTTPDNKALFPADPSSQMVTLSADGLHPGVDLLCTVRTSGTEPKVKFYLEASGTDRAHVSDDLFKLRRALTLWLKPDVNNLALAPGESF